jgi:selenocysteine lyase/cysteine desulfurase
MSDLDLAALRAMTPGCAHRNHLNNAGAALMSTVTIAAMTDYLQREALIGGYEAEAEAAALIGDVRESLAGADVAALLQHRGGGRSGRRCRRGAGSQSPVIC